VESPPPGRYHGKIESQAGRKLRILSVSTVFPNPRETGLGLFVRARLERMAELADIVVVAPVARFDYSQAPGGEGAIPRRRQEGRLKVMHPRWLYPPLAGAWNGVFLFLALAGLACRLRRRFRFEVIDAHFGHPEGVAGALLGALLSCPVVITLRGNETMHARYRLRRYWMAWALRRATRVIAVSERLRQFAVSLGAAEERTRTIPNGIDVSIFYPRDRQRLRRDLGMTEGPSIVSAGYLIERKGHHRVVRALASLRGNGIAAELWIVGGPGREGEFETEIRREVEQAGLREQVHFTGAVAPARLAEYLSAADVFCLASTREGWPNVVHEALGCGAPVVATDVGGIPDMLPSGEYGMIVPPADQSALEQALRQALAKPWDRDRIAQWGQARSWEQVAAEAVGQLRAAAERPPARRAA